MKAAKLARAAALVVGCALLSGCNAPHSEEVEGNGAAAEAPPAPPVQTVALTASSEAVKLEGIATVLNPDVLLQLDADIRSATIAADFSRGQLERFRASTMLSRQTLESAVRQAGIDASQLKLLSTRLRQTWGDKAPFLDVEARQQLMSEIASGSRVILRIDFPDAAVDGPRDIRVMPLGGGAETKVGTFWPAPSGNLAMPGVSYLGVTDAGPGLRTGDRARVIADSASKPTGVVIPSAALVVYASKSWCYVEAAPGKYERKLVSLDAPVDDGYLVKSGFGPGTRVVVKGASILLAREATPGSLDDDDDGAAAPPPLSAPATKSSTSPVAQNHAATAGDPD